MASSNVLVPVEAVPGVVDAAAAEKPQSPTVNSSTSSPVKPRPQLHEQTAPPRGQIVIQPPPPRQLGQQPVQVAQPLLVTVTSAAAAEPAPSVVLQPPLSSSPIVVPSSAAAAPSPPIVYSNAPSTFSISLPVHPIPFGQLGQHGEVGPPPGRVLAQVGNAPVQQVLLDQPGVRAGQWGAPAGMQTSSSSTAVSGSPPSLPEYRSRVVAQALQMCAIPCFICGGAPLRIRQLREHLQSSHTPQQLSAVISRIVIQRAATAAAAAIAKQQQQKQPPTAATASASSSGTTYRFQQEGGGGPAPHPGPQVAPQRQSAPGQPDPPNLMRWPLVQGAPWNPPRSHFYPPRTSQRAARAQKVQAGPVRPYPRRQVVCYPYHARQRLDQRANAPSKFHLEIKTKRSSPDGTRGQQQQEERRFMEMSAHDFYDVEFWRDVAQNVVNYAEVGRSAPAPSDDDPRPREVTVKPRDFRPAAAGAPPAPTALVRAKNGAYIRVGSFRPALAAVASGGAGAVLCDAEAQTPWSCAPREEFFLVPRSSREQQVYILPEQITVLTEDMDSAMASFASGGSGGGLSLVDACFGPDMIPGMGGIGGIPTNASAAANSSSGVAVGGGADFPATSSSSEENSSSVLIGYVQENGGIGGSAASANADSDKNNNAANSLRGTEAMTDHDKYTSPAALGL